MSARSGAIALTKWVAGASFVILSVGILYMPSDSEKIRKMNERIRQMDSYHDDQRKKNQSSDSNQSPLVDSSNKSLNKQPKSSNKPSDAPVSTNVNLFKDI